MSQNPKQNDGVREFLFWTDDKEYTWQKLEREPTDFKEKFQGKVHRLISISAYQALEAELRTARLRNENLSAIIRKMKRWAGTRKPEIVCEKILELKCGHLLTELNPLKIEATK